jgi:hypothetical protein
VANAIRAEDFVRVFDDGMQLGAHMPFRARSNLGNRDSYHARRSRGVSRGTRQGARAQSMRASAEHERA